MSAHPLTAPALAPDRDRVGRDELATLAAGLCHDAGLRVEVVEAERHRWAYDPYGRVLRVPSAALVERGGDWCAGRVTNEVGHFWLTRHELFAIGFPSERIGRVLVDLLEDGRVNGWMSTRYPGVGRWLGAVYADMVLPHDVPMVVLFGMACALDAAGGELPTDLPSPVVDALVRTRAARARYAAFVPSTTLGTTGTDVARRYRDRVWPELVVPGRMPTLFEAEVQLAALDAVRVWRDELLPEFLALYRADLGCLAAWLASHPKELAEVPGCCADGRAGALLRRAMGEGAPSTSTSGEALRAAMRLMDAFAGEERPGGRVVTGDRWTPGSGWRAPPPGLDLRRAAAPVATPYDVLFDRVADQIERLVRRLDRILLPRRRMGARAGYPSGRRADLRALMAFDADPRRYDELWIRDTVPERRRAVFSLLVDLSGSMQGERIEYAMLGTILLAETLARLHVPFAITGFQDQLIPVSSVHEPFGAPVRARMAGMVNEVFGNNPGGRNMPAYNDDGPCVLEAANALLAESAEDRILVVVSDGLPAGCRSTADDLHAAIGALASAPLELLGVGLGAHTDHVGHFYPQSIANVPLASFADALAGLIERGLRAEASAAA